MSLNNECWQQELREITTIRVALNSLAPWRSDSNLKVQFSDLSRKMNSLGTRCQIDIRLMPQNLTIEKSALVQAMPWYHQATSHCQSQFWPRFMSLYGITRPKWVKPEYPLPNRIALPLFRYKVLYISIICLPNILGTDNVCRDNPADDVWIWIKFVLTWWRLNAPGNLVNLI